MGLFSNKKKGCPFCGEPTPRLFPKKIEGTPICRDCEAKIELPDGVLDNMSLDQLGDYMEFYEANQELRDLFHETDNFGHGFLSTGIYFDFNNGLFRLKPGNSSLVFESTNLKSFRILEDNTPVFTGDSVSLQCYESTVPQRIQALQPALAQFMESKRNYEQMKMMREMADSLKDDDDKSSSRYNPEPTFTGREPFKKCTIVLEMAHPYWKKYTREESVPQFDIYDPDLFDYMNKYEEHSKKMRGLAEMLMKLINPNAPVMNVPNGAAAAAPGMQAGQRPGAASAADIADQLQKFTELLYMGAITEEEFAAKKRQLLSM